MSLLIVYPQNAPKAYAIAAETFCDLCNKITGEKPGMVTDVAAARALPAHPALTLVVIGGDDVNLLAREHKELLPIPSGGEGYAVLSATLRGHNALLLWGGRGRSTLYAVYRYFEVFAGCRWFWDGGKLPTLKSLPMENVRLIETTKFLYRGTRYFAHRGLHRFQAEHWNAEDWQNEVDWLLKKRLNLMMLRIGQDDLFQKAFPHLADYPDSKASLPFTGDGFNDRTLFWDLPFRGELRKQVLQYAKDRDLLLPEDCGTMTHWYSPTPRDFLEKRRPTLLAQPKGTNYAESTGLVWDIREEENLDLYFQLTDTHIREYGQTGLFHTIGLAERAFSKDREENLRLKLLTYRLICRRLREQYPGSKLLLASWDLWMFYTPKEVQTLLAQLDKEQVVLLDYTSDSARESNYRTWGVEGQFPWIMGIFHAYQPSNDVRGDYEMLTKRLQDAKKDPFCKGLVFWPELSHGDPFMTEFFASNAWEVSEQSVEEQLFDFCNSRYTHGEELFTLWQKVLPLAKLMSWSKYEAVTPWVETDIFCRCAYTLDFERDDPKYDDYLLPLEASRGDGVWCLRRISLLLGQEDRRETRDLYDLARTILTRYLNGLTLTLCRQYSRGEAVADTADALVELLTLYGDFLATNREYSLFHTLCGLNETAPVNPHFTPTLKRNCDNLYCRSAVTECVQELYLPEAKKLVEMLKGKTYDKAALISFSKANQAAFEARPLTPTVPKELPARILQKTAEVLEKITP